MEQWHGKHCKEDYSESKQGRHSKLPLIEQFSLTLTTGLDLRDITVNSIKDYDNLDQLNAPYL